MTVNGPLLTRVPTPGWGWAGKSLVTAGVRSRSRSWPGRGTGLVWRGFSLNKTNDCLLQLFGQTQARPRCRPPSIITLRGATDITCSHGYSKYTPVSFAIFLKSVFTLFSLLLSLTPFLLLTASHGPPWQVGRPW